MKQAVSKIEAGNKTQVKAEVKQGKDRLKEESNRVNRYNGVTKAHNKHKSK